MSNSRPKDWSDVRFRDVTDAVVEELRERRVILTLRHLTWVAWILSCISIWAAYQVTSPFGDTHYTIVMMSANTLIFLYLSMLLLVGYDIVRIRVGTNP